MRIRRRNWILKRIVLGLAVTALVAPGAANARVDEGGAGQPNSIAEVSKGSSFVPFATDFPKYEYSSVKAGDYGMPRAMPNDYAKAGVDLRQSSVEPRTTVRDIEATRQVGSSDVSVPVARTTVRDIEATRQVGSSVSVPVVSSPGFDWGDAGIGAGFALGLALLAGASLRATRHLGRPQTA